MLIKISKIFIISCLILMTLVFFPIKAEAKTLREIYSELDALQAEIDANKSQQQATTGEISSANNQINTIAREITEAQESLGIAKQEVITLGIEIDETKEETEDILKYFQVSSGEAEYLEYIFGAEDLTDFIHRNAVVEKLTEYNETMINNMNESIKEQEELQVKLAKQKIELANKQDDLRDTRVKLYGVQTSLKEEFITIEEEINATRDMIELYESLGTCNLDDDINVCAANIIPPDTRFWRPLDTGYVTSEWGWRIHPTSGNWSFHSGVDLGNSGNTGAPVYASAAGKVSKIVYQSSCGGNMVFVNHNIKGVSYTTAYLHLHSINVKLKDNVTKNNVIGTVGGGEAYDYCTTGPHLHFSIMQGITASLSGSNNPRDHINLPASRYVWFYDRITRY